MTEENSPHARYRRTLEDFRALLETHLKTDGEISLFRCGRSFTFLPDTSRDLLRALDVALTIDTVVCDPQHNTTIQELIDRVARVRDWLDDPNSPKDVDHAILNLPRELWPHLSGALHIALGYVRRQFYAHEVGLGAGPKWPGPLFGGESPKASTPPPAPFALVPEAPPPPPATTQEWAFRVIDELQTRYPVNAHWFELIRRDLKASPWGRRSLYQPAPLCVLDAIRRLEWLRSVIRDKALDELAHAVECVFNAPPPPPPPAVPLLDIPPPNGARWSHGEGVFDVNVIGTFKTHRLGDAPIPWNIVTYRGETYHIPYVANPPGMVQIRVSQHPHRCALRFHALRPTPDGRTHGWRNPPAAYQDEEGGAKYVLACADLVAEKLGVGNG
jgi:hypothetical protein